MQVNVSKCMRKVHVQVKCTNSHSFIVFISMCTCDLSSIWQLSAPPSRDVLPVSRWSWEVSVSTRVDGRKTYEVFLGFGSFFGLSGFFLGFWGFFGLSGFFLGIWGFRGFSWVSRAFRIFFFGFLVFFMTSYKG